MGKVSKENMLSKLELPKVEQRSKFSHKSSEMEASSGVTEGSIRGGETDERQRQRLELHCECL